MQFLTQIKFNFISESCFLRATLYQQVLLRARISYGNSVSPSVCLSWCHDPVPNQAQVRQRLQVFTIW